MNEIGCLVCGAMSKVKIGRRKKSGCLYVTIVCTVDDLHFRIFINDQQYVGRVVREARRRGLTNTS